MSLVKNNVFPLRFDDKKTKNAIKRIAKKEKLSLNQQINALVRDKIELEKSKQS